jgi:acyl-CoA thioesterase-2
MYGGQLLAQALAAASFTVPPEWTCHSLHAYFVRTAQAARPTDYEVAQMRDGKAGGLRKVVAVQRDELACELTASFQLEAPSVEHQTPQLTAAESDFEPKPEHKRRNFGPIELVLIDGRDYEHPPTQPMFGRFRTLARMVGPLNDDPNLHRCALTYASDASAVEPSLRAIAARHGDSDLAIASLDHAIWFHRPFRFDDWLLFDFDCVSVAAERGLNRGYVYSRSGALVASIIQETMLRRRDVIAGS